MKILSFEGYKEGWKIKQALIFGGYAIDLPYDRSYLGFTIPALKKTTKYSFYQMDEVEGFWDHVFGVLVNHKGIYPKIEFVHFQRVRDQ